MTCRSYTTAEDRLDSFVGVSGDSCTLFRNLLLLALIKCVKNCQQKSSHLRSESELICVFNESLNSAQPLVSTLETFPFISAENDLIRASVSFL